jgi:hypothetical protein
MEFKETTGNCKITKLLSLHGRKEKCKKKRKMYKRKEKVFRRKKMFRRLKIEKKM